MNANEVNLSDYQFFLVIGKDEKLCNFEFTLVLRSIDELVNQLIAGLDENQASNLKWSVRHGLLHIPLFTLYRALPREYAILFRQLDNAGCYLKYIDYSIPNK